jgi:GNAT superfamily N-acetyltransferase
MNTFNILGSSKNEIDFVEQEICNFNESHVSFEPRIPFSEINKHIKDDNGNIIAGINCIYYAWKCLCIDALWVQEGFRHAGLGSKLLAETEKTAREYGCHLIHVDSFDFQAKDFYMKHGYVIYGVLDDCPQGHKRYYLKKMLY